MKVNEEVPVMNTDRAIRSMKNIIEYWTYRPSELEAAKLSIKALEKEIPLKVIKIEGVSSQACPVCKSNVNWKYCSNCGQKISY